MKCPKCGYISFDYNHTCPKCNKNISSEREKMNLPSYKPSPPSLLGSLLDGSKKAAQAKASDSGSISFADSGTSFSPDDSEAIEAIGEAFEDSQELEIKFGTTSDMTLEDTLEPIALDDSSEHPVVDNLLDEVELEASLDTGTLPEGEPSVVPDLADLSKSSASAAPDKRSEGAGIHEPDNSKAAADSEEIDLTLDGLDLDMTDDFEPGSDLVIEDEAEPGVAPVRGPKKQESDKVVSLDLDTLDLELDSDDR